MDEIVLITYFFSLLILLVFGSHGFVMVYLHNKYGKKKLKEAENFKMDKPVTIQLPMYNELYVAERLIDTVCEIEYPKDLLEIQVLDDSTDETAEIVDKIVKAKQVLGFDIKHIRRNSREGFKAGALKEGLKTAKGDYVAIFDADFVPKKDFLKKTLRFFADDNVGMVQTRWEHLNEDYSLLTKIQAFALDGHFVIEQTTRNKAGLFFSFNGTGGIWKKDCIFDAGNWGIDTLTEDLDLSYRAQLKGWKFVFLKDYSCPAELPAEMNALKAQQFRWTKGYIETAKKILPLVWKADIPLRIKYQSTVHLTSNIVYPFILLAGILNVPLIFIKNSGPWDFFFNLMSIFILGFISSFALYYTSQKEGYEDWQKKIALFPLFMAGSMGFALNNSRAVVEGLLSRKSEFVRTPKFKLMTKGDTWANTAYTKKKKTDISVYVETLLAVYCFIGVIASIYFMEFAALPFQLLFFTGFASVAGLSIKHSLGKNN
ncbi:MAG TPA: glycosyltransferase [Ignavibacteriales bacterium]|nr:glycosyltransferase [Ignavibacteriales bacterium]